MVEMTKADGGNESKHDDERVDAVETVRIQWSEFKKALRNDYLTDTDKRRSGHSVLRLRAPFEATAEAEYHFSEQGRHYSSDVDPKPVHIRPHQIIETGRDDGWRWISDYPDRAQVRDALREEEIEDMGGLDAAVEESRDIWWDELRAQLPGEFDLGKCAAPYSSKRVDIEWVFDEEGA